ncbi:hypothetical protein RE476_02935 [Methanolobus mangrovi]|uniref:Uncharacterized protein n=1 Tax=Methanolobus mangrovi TaxID=3072977 RepID=A0AA51UGN7_9EURY|nr:hypothetical protein [Methanolobus mangrovi]WMW22795.1 hypothetical protein RE476_02935 [Methanolobus mangrovi]
MEKSHSYVLMIIVIAFLISLSTNMWSCGPVQIEGLFLVDGSSSIGSSDANDSNNIFSYSFTLYNSGSNDIYITTIEPVLSQSPYIVSSQDSLRQEINKLVVSGSYVIVEGTIELTGNVSKEEIMNLEPIVHVNVSSTETIPYFNY